MKNLFISLSGGLTSAYMLHYILNSKKYVGFNILVAFANTGKEREETLIFVNEISKRWGVPVKWIEYNPLEEHGKKNWFKVVDFKKASRNGEPFEKFIAKERLPNAAYPGCSTRLKQLPLQNYAKTYFSGRDYVTAIGIRWDEKHRINTKKIKEGKYIYPLVTDFPTTKEIVHAFWEQQNFTLNLKSYEGNCDCCWKKSQRKLLTIANENPDLFEWWNQMELKYGDGYSFFRNNTDSVDILKESEHFPESKYAKCDTEISKEKAKQLSFFDLDNETPCNCQI